MDLSQQELPLTTYFTRGRKEIRAHAVSDKKDKLAEDSPSVARPSKRSRSSVGCSASNSSASQSNPRLKTMQLPTPATSARKRARAGRLDGSPGRIQPLSSIEHELAVPESPTIPLATPSTDIRTSKPIHIGFPIGPPLSNHAATGIATPQTSLGKLTKRVHDVDDLTPLSRTNCSLHSKSGGGSPRLQDPDVFCAVPSRVELLVCPTTGPLRSSPDLGFSDCPDLWEKNSIVVPSSTQPKQCLTPSKALNGQSSDGHIIPMIPVPSSQSQYLLRLDATPKRERRFRHVEPVTSSQTQEERELMILASHKPVVVNLSAGMSPEKHTVCGDIQIHRLDRNKRKSQYGSTPVGSPIESSADPPRFFGTRKAGDELSPEPSQRNRSTSRHYRSSKAKTKTSGGSACCDSTEKIPPACIEDSLTESESDPEIFQAPRRSPVSRGACLSARELIQRNLSEDDSATEAESDTEILHCVAEISKRQPRKRSEAPRETTLPAISPLVSPTRPRIAFVPPGLSDTQICMQEGAGLDVPGSYTSYPPGMEQPRMHSRSLPSVVQEFIRMFPGDESYPADFPESLRV